jgi:hypothetical protein
MFYIKTKASERETVTFREFLKEVNLKNSSRESLCLNALAGVSVSK